MDRIRGYSRVVSDNSFILDYIFQSFPKGVNSMMMVSKSDLMGAFQSWLGHDELDRSVVELMEEYPEVKEIMGKHDKLLLQGAIMLLDDLGIELVDG